MNESKGKAKWGRANEAGKKGKRILDGKRGVIREKLREISVNGFHFFNNYEKVR